MPEPVLVAVAHGSKDPRASATIGELMALVAERAARRGLGVPDPRTAFLGHAPPSLPQVMSTFEAGRQVRRAAAAAHRGVPQQDRHPPHAGPGRRAPAAPGHLRRHARAAPAAAPRAGTAPGRGGPRHERPGRTAVVLAAAGSSDPEANATIARLAAQWQARPGGTRCARPTPRPPTPRRRRRWPACCRPGCRRVVVATYLLAPGLFADRIRDTRWPRARPPSPPRSAPAPMWPTCCSTVSRRRRPGSRLRRKTG